MGSPESAQCNSGNHEAEDARLQKQLDRVRHKLLVMSGKGGVGKSSVAVHLALGLAKLGHRVGLLDVDLHGPSIPRMLGLEGLFSISQDQLMIPHAYSDRLGY